MNFESLDLNLLRVLHLVLTEGSVQRAARRLHLTSPAVSNALARLREALGDPLVVRAGRRLAPTPFAEALAPRLAGLLVELEAALAPAARFDAERDARTYTLACADLEWVCTVPALAASMARTLPAARLRVIDVAQLEAAGGLSAGAADLCFAPAGPTPAGVFAEDLLVDEAAWVLRAGHPALVGGLSTERFGALRHVEVHLLGRPGRGQARVQQALAGAGLAPEVAMTVPGFAAAACVASGSDLVAGLPLRLAQHLASRYGLVVWQPPGPPLQLTLALWWHRRTDGDPGQRLFRTLVATAARAGAVEGA